VCTKLGIPFWVGERDVPAAEGGIDVIKTLQPKAFINDVIAGAWGGPGHPVDRALKEGDEVAGFTVIDAPGHSAGQVAYWRESDRVLILGDVVNTMNLATSIPGLREPPKRFTPDPVTNRASIRKLAALQPALVCAGHGPPWRDGEAFVNFANGLPTD
jgi:glyoxylase-like metal-dependent hydrolase (beta-lactamase superfamily II)